DVLTEDAKRLFDLSRELYTRIGTLADHADKLRRSIDSTVGAYNAFASSLETRVLVTARRLGDLDETKVLAEPRPVEQRPKQLTAPEMTPELTDGVDTPGRELTDSAAIDAELAELAEIVDAAEERRL